MALSNIRSNSSSAVAPVEADTPPPDALAPEAVAPLEPVLLPLRLADFGSFSDPMFTAEAAREASFAEVEDKNDAESALAPFDDAAKEEEEEDRGADRDRARAPPLIFASMNLAAATDTRTRCRGKGRHEHGTTKRVAVRALRYQATRVLYKFIRKRGKKTNCNKVNEYGVLARITQQESRRLREHGIKRVTASRALHESDM